MKKTIFLILIAVLHFTACSDKDEIFFEGAVKTLNVEADNKTKTSATFQGSIDITPDKPDLIEEIGFCYAPVENPTIEKSDTVKGKKQDYKKFTAQANLGIAIKTYYVRAYAIIKGKTFYGNTICFTTNTTHTVKFAGDSIKIASLQVTHDSTATSPDDPTRKGYIFGGWFKDEKKEYKWDFKNDKVTQDTTLWAGWDASTHTITFEMQDGTALTLYTKPVIYGQAVGALPTPYRKGYEFKGWFTGIDGVGTQYKDTTIYGVGGNITLYAGWKEIEYEIYYVLNEGENDPENPKKYTIETSITLNNPIRTGYFGKWTEGCIIPLGSTGNKTFTAKWKATEYTITYGLNGGINHPQNPATYTIESPEIELQNPTKKGYDFEGWKTSDGTVATGIIIPKGSIGNKNYTADWEAKTYTITLNVMGGKALTNNTISVCFDQQINILPIPEHSNSDLKFAGWFTGVDGTGTKYMGTTVYRATHNLTLYAKWEDADTGDK